jgi:hypothetical protein
MAAILFLHYLLLSSRGDFLTAEWKQIEKELEKIKVLYKY